MSGLSALLALVAFFAVPDTIYLVSGRVIHTESVRVEGGRVHFTQFGGEVSIPLDEVVRIVEDDKAEKVVTVPNKPADPATEDTSAGDTGELVLDASTEQPGAAPASAGDETAPSIGALTPDQPDYWIERIQQVDEQMARVQSEIDRLPYYDETDQRLLRFSGQARYFMAQREKWEKLMERLELNRQRLLYGARKAGITPGSLRRGLGK